jgi:hypothetical protein
MPVWLLMIQIERYENCIVSVVWGSNVIKSQAPKKLYFGFQQMKARPH